MVCEDAPRLLQERRDAVQRGDFDRMKAIDEERWAHDSSPDECCECWQQARREAGSVVTA
jgi:hypothetical protein